MQRICGTALIVSAMLAWPQLAAAQRTPVPDTGMLAVGLTAGVGMPTDAALGAGFELGAQAEGYLSPRLSVRGRLSGDWFNINGRPFTGTIEPVAVEGNVVYNWEHGTWHPYATGGLGLYHFRFTEANIPSTDNKVGVNGGGGVEYFLTRHDTVLVEGLVRIIPGRTDSVLSDYETGYWSILAGYKKYF